MIVFSKNFKKWLLGHVSLLANFIKIQKYTDIQGVQIVTITVGKPLFRQFIFRFKIPRVCAGKTGQKGISAFPEHLRLSTFIQNISKMNILKRCKGLFRVHFGLADAISLPNQTHRAFDESWLSNFMSRQSNWQISGKCQNSHFVANFGLSCSNFK